jgi:hypothetical protein
MCGTFLSSAAAQEEKAAVRQIKARRAKALRIGAKA